MALTLNIIQVVERIAGEFRAIRTMLTGSPTGDVSSLPLKDKNLLNAVTLTMNNLDTFTAAVDNWRQSGEIAAIWDPAPSLTTTYSGTKIDELIAAAGGGGAAIDDTTASLTTVFSSAKVQELVDVDGYELVAAFDTALNS